MQGYDKVADGSKEWPKAFKVAVQELKDQAGTIPPPISAADVPAPEDVPGGLPA
jgi:hypothetical protein